MAINVDEITPNIVVDPITDAECESLGNNTGLDPDEGLTNCEVFNKELIPLLQQEVNAILRGSDLNIYANDESKCVEDTLPTHASMWSRIYRYAQALTCILCKYDPFLATLLKSGRYPQVLMAAEGSEYPVWQTPDSTPRAGSQVPVTSGGVYTAIQNAILSVWHIWEEHPEFDYYARTLTARDALTGMEDGDTVLVRDGETDEYNVIYSWNETAEVWVKEEVVGVDIPNLTVTHINKGYFEDKEIYYMNADGSPLWSLLDANIQDLEDRIAVVEREILQAVNPQDGTTKYLLTTRATFAQADAVPETTGKTTIALITG